MMGQEHLQHPESVEVLEDVEARHGAVGEKGSGEVVGHGLNAAVREYAVEIIEILGEKAVCLILVEAAGIAPLLDCEGVEVVVDLLGKEFAGMDHVAAEEVGDYHADTYIIIFQELIPGCFGRDTGIASEIKLGSHLHHLAGIAVKTDGSEHFVAIEHQEAYGHARSAIAAVGIILIFQTFHYRRAWEWFNIDWSISVGEVQS